MGGGAWDKKCMREQIHRNQDWRWGILLLLFFSLLLNGDKRDTRGRLQPFCCCAASGWDYRNSKPTHTHERRLEDLIKRWTDGQLLEKVIKNTDVTLWISTLINMGHYTHAARRVKVMRSEIESSAYIVMCTSCYWWCCLWFSLQYLLHVMIQLHQ